MARIDQASINRLKEHLSVGEFADADDMNILKSLIDFEVNTRRKQNYHLTSEIAQSNKQFDTALYINNLIGGLRKLHKTKFQLVTQNITFIKALFDLVEKIEKLMTYKDQTKYGDNAGCDGECRGLCSGCEASCTGANSCAFVAGGGGSGKATCDSYTDGYCATYQNLYKATVPSGNVYATYYNGQFHIINEHGAETGYVINGAPGVTRSTSGTFNIPGQQLSTYFEKVASQNSNLNVYSTSRGGGGSSGQTDHDGNGCSNMTTNHGVKWNPDKYNGGCGAKNYSH